MQDVLSAQSKMNNTLNCGPLTVNGVFDDNTVSAVKYFKTKTPRMLAEHH